MERLQALLRGEGTSHILPFLWMKGEDNGTIRSELDKIEECGIREICLESRPHPDFCGPGWWENLDFILEEARCRDMRVWVLDDDKFPTGHANGGFLKHPEKKKVYLAERHMDIMGPCRSGAVLVENFLQPDGQLLGILAVPKPDGETPAVSGEGIIDLTDRYENGFVYFDLPQGPYRLFVLFTTRKGGGREDYMNLIDSDSVKVLIDEVYEKHYERYGEYFGTTLAGFFSDEPELGNVNGYPFDNALGQKDRRLPWSAQLEDALRQRWGGEFLSSLPALWYESGEKTAAVRSQYMDEMTALVKTCFSGQLGQWCGDHGVEYIGHIIEDDNAHTRMACSIGHYFREMEGQHMAGIDVVHHQIVPGFTEPVHQWIAGDRDGEFFHFGLAKLGSSAAHIQENKKGRALCEIFGNYGWAEGNSLMKWLTNHMLVRGINVFTPHAFSMSYPDRDCPPHFYARGNNPGFECFTQLMKYMNRAAHLLSAGAHVADAAILYHAEAEWSGADTMFFQKPGRKLMESQLDYDVIPADVLRDGRSSVENGRLVVGKAQYPCLILPYARRMDAETARFVIGAAAQGLKVFVIDALPESDTWGRPLPAGWEQAGAAAGTEPGAADTAEPEIADTAEPGAADTAELEIVDTAEPGAADTAELEIADTAEQETAGTAHPGTPYIEVVSLDQIAGKVSLLEERLGGRSVKVTEGIPELRSLVMRHGDGLTAMFFNESVTRKTQARVRVSDEMQAEVTLYDPWNHKAETYGMEGNTVPLSLEPGEAVFLCFEKKEGAEHAAGEKAARFPRLTDSQTLFVDWKVSRRAELETHFGGETVLKAGEELPNLNGPGYWPAFTGTYRYEGSFVWKKEAQARYCLLLRSASDCVKVRLNGVDCGWLAGFPARVDITQALTDGDNRLELEAATTLVWKRKDGASTHLQVQASGITAEPVIQKYE